MSWMPVAALSALAAFTPVTGFGNLKLGMPFEQVRARVGGYVSNVAECDDKPDKSKCVLLGASFDSRPVLTIGGAAYYYRLQFRPDGRLRVIVLESDALSQTKRQCYARHAATLDWAAARYGRFDWRHDPEAPTLTLTSPAGNKFPAMTSTTSFPSVWKMSSLYQLAAPHGTSVHGAYTHTDFSTSVVTLNLSFVQHQDGRGGCTTSIYIAGAPWSA